MLKTGWHGKGVVEKRVKGRCKTPKNMVKKKTERKGLGHDPFPYPVVQQWTPNHSRRSFFLRGKKKKKKKGGSNQGRTGQAKRPTEVPTPTANLRKSQENPPRIRNWGGQTSGKTGAPPQRGGRHWGGFSKEPGGPQRDGRDQTKRPRTGKNDTWGGGKRRVIYHSTELQKAKAKRETEQKKKKTKKREMGGTFPGTQNLKKVLGEKGPGDRPRKTKDKKIIKTG